MGRDYRLTYTKVDYGIGGMTMKTYDVYKAAIEEDIFRFKRKSDGDIYVWDDNRKKLTPECSGYYNEIGWEEDWEVVPTQYRKADFREVVESNKSFYVVHETQIDTFFASLGDFFETLGDTYTSSSIRDILMYSEFYIHD